MPPEAPAADALRKLSEGQDDMILVLRDGRLEGIVTRTDVARIVQILGAGAG
ncbi:MAG TPA: CBS domain-containing protein [Candidatus Thermoplasmatota archaeon]|nr:CBS domain-containing protein [Candidatus Thermoplasmatota archaeon]